ncbi:MAG: DUF502 domain-containing protein [Ignavibacteriales bacterium]|nr:DUF502 domain-containing protein [Ignavibacteriales bacterium]
MSRFFETLRQSFMSGLAVIVPLALTLWVLNAILSWVDRLIAPTLRTYGLDFPGLGVVTMVLLILLIGVLSRNLVGRMVLRGIDFIIVRIPVARAIYSAVKDLIGAFSLGKQGRTFREVVLVEYPRKGVYSIGFATNDLTARVSSRRTHLVSVYFPHPPNPTSGVMVLVPRKEVRILDLSVEEGLKLALSAGIVAPHELVERTRRPSVQS